MVRINGLEVMDMGMIDRMVKAAPTEGQGKAAARTWAVIQSVGWQAAKDSMLKSTWYKPIPSPNS
jgi:hypothetical protein